MRRYREGILSRAILIYKKDTSERKIKFSDFKDGTADLLGCGFAKDYLVYTTSKDRFREVDGANKNKAVTFIGPCHMVQDLLPASDKKPSSIVMLWRWGSCTNLNCFDYLVSVGIDVIPMFNMQAIWAKSESAGVIECLCAQLLRQSGSYHKMFVCEPKLEL